MRIIYVQFNVLCLVYKVRLLNEYWIEKKRQLPTKINTYVR